MSVQVLDEELEDFRVRKRREVSNKEVREECLHFVVVCCSYFQKLMHLYLKTCSINLRIVFSYLKFTQRNVKTIFNMV